MGFENKVAIVTGGAMGNGLGIVKVLAEKGAKISILDYSDTVETTVSDLKKQGYDVIGFKVDIRNKPEVKKCVDATFEKFGRLDILVNNAGVLKCEPFLEMSDELRDFHLDVNVKGPWNVTQCALPYMIKNHYGRVVTISSVTGEYVGDAGDMAYGTSKAALIGFAKCLAMEVADKGITSNVLCPGYILTPMVEQLAKDIEDKTGIESRATVLGHVQRGGSPTLRDRVVASEMGYKAVELLVQGKSNRVVAMRHGDIVDFDITEALQMKKQFNKELYDIALKISI